MTIQKEDYFIELCKTKLPNKLKVDGINYQIHAHGLMSGGFRISYAEFDGTTFNWNNKPIDLFYKVVEVIPKKKDYTSAGFSDSTVYVKTLEEVLEHCSLELSKWHKGLYKELDEIITKDEEFIRELTSLLNKYSKENLSKTPDFILAKYLIGCLRTFNYVVNDREKWYGR